MDIEESPVTLGDLKRWPLLVKVMIGLSLLLLFGVYVFYPVYPGASYRTLGSWTWSACNSYNGFLHGRLVPLIFPWMIWWAWRSRKQEVVNPSYWSLVWMCLALFLFLASMRLVQPRWALFGLPFLVIGLAQYLFGGRIAKAVIFPAFFLWFAIPIPGLVGWIQQQAITWLIPSTYEAGLLMGFDVEREGESIVLHGYNLWIGGL